MIRTLTGDFKDVDDIHAMLMRRSSDQYTHSEWYWIIACSPLANTEGMLTGARAFKLSPGYDEATEAHKPRLEYQLNGSDEWQTTTLDFSFTQCPPCLQKDQVDKGVLRDARPDLSVFISQYPLQPAHANALRLLLSNIEHVDCRKLVHDLEPYIQEAIACGLALKNNNNYASTEILDEIDSVVKSVNEKVKATEDSLPTVKEILSLPKVDLTWE